MIWLTFTATEAKEPMMSRQARMTQMVVKEIRPWLKMLSTPSRI